MSKILKPSKNLMNMINQKKTRSLYIHIPFCKNICPYCDFIKFIYNESFLSNYLVEIEKDLDRLIEQKFKFKTIYIGGGTPSILSDEQLEKLLSKIEPLKDFSCEFTIEANPESITESKLQILNKHEVNRISIGIQSFNKSILKEIGRDFDVDYFALIELVKKYVENINVDLIYGFENETEEILKEDLANFIKLDIDHISIYSLTIYPNTVFAVKGKKEQKEEDSRSFYNLILSTLREHGYERYEVSNFARNKKYSNHNLTYWNNEEYVGIGVGSSGYENGIRYTNSGNLSSYLKGERNKEEEKVSLFTKMEYHLITSLRLEKGLSLPLFKNLYGVDFFEKFPKSKQFIEQKLLKIDGDYIHCTDEGMLLLDYILLRIL